jgi:GH25 family lysozyme M1 (1,4-beta-N-acetylmuramidase)
MSNPICVDLSHHNPEPNWAQLKAGGTLGVILKATEGTTYTDKTFATRRGRAKAAGLKVASYHFLKHGKVAAQMEHYLETVAPEPGERVVIDYEDAACVLADLRDAVRWLLSQPLDLQVTVYSGHLIKEQLGTTKDVLLADTALWIAQYGSTVSWPTATWPAWSLWQYTDKETVAGISAPVDGNRFNGSDDNFLKWFGPAGAEPVPPEPEPLPEMPVVAVSVPLGVTVAVTNTSDGPVQVTVANEPWGPLG